MANIYALINPVTGNIFYIGSTKKTIAERLDQHLYTAIDGAAKSSRYIRLLLRNNITPVAQLLELSVVSQFEC